MIYLRRGEERMKRTGEETKGWKERRGEEKCGEERRQNDEKKSRQQETR